ncbi:DMT family transporter [Parvularcula dongshanensis]|uniref:Multidrug transporter EmrE-like cation transporter n=1 Tax=Parvularcula dongshanensis TaxID=1173995 RepID=A0A840HZW7_9PROT|nr:SMR family transporter [Parvularcula dongshanensis]MBB4657967.1 multidrug transporter EmrE-like cation transporter [Parvularcula dongshanensis]
MNPAWFLVGLAVCANVATNASLKRLMQTVTPRPAIGFAFELMASPWAWIAGVSGMTLLGAYVLALRSLDLSTSYAVTTSAALIGITLVSITLLGEQATLTKLGGVGLVILGIVLLSRS